MLSTKRWTTKEAAVADLLNWAAVIDDGIVLTKSGSLIAGYYYAGKDLASSTDEERNYLTARLNAALCRFGSGWTAWFEAVRLPTERYPAPDAGHFPDPISRMVDDERRNQFETQGTHFESEYALILEYTPPLRRKGRLVDMFFSDGSKKRSHTETSVADRILAQFKQHLENFEDALGEALGGPNRIMRMVSGVETDPLTGREYQIDGLVNFLQFTISGQEVSLRLPENGMYLDAVLGGQELWSGLEPRVGDNFIACVAIEGFPAESSPGLLDALDHLAIPYRWSSRFIFLDKKETLEELSRYHRQWKQKIRGLVSQVFQTVGGTINEDAMKMADQAQDAKSHAESDEVTFGYYTPVVVLMHHDRDVLLGNARLVSKTIQSLGFASRVETINTMEAWLGSLPGHSLPNVRRPLIHTLNLADLLPLASVWAGLGQNPCPFYPPGSPCLLHAATAGATPLRINLHVDDVGHTLIFGPTGAGKSTLLATIALQALRYEGVTIFSFDKGRSMYTAVKACGGVHHDIGDDASKMVFCPLGRLETRSEIAWAEEWIATCYQLQTGKPLLPLQKDAVHKAMLLLADEPADRSLTAFVHTVQSDEVRDAMRYYCLGGTMGHLMDGKSDNLTTGYFTTFEIDALMAMGEDAALPTLLYLFQVFERSLKGQPAYLLLDEAWIMLGHPVFREKIREWLKELRKKNCAVVIATQSLSDAARSGILDILLESCPTKIFLPNEEARKTGTETHPGPYDLYTSMGLNDVQIHIIQTAAKKRQYYFESPQGRRLFELGLGPIALSFVAVSSKEDIKRVKQLEETYGQDWPMAWLEERGTRLPIRAQVTRNQHRPVFA